MDMDQRMGVGGCMLIKAELWNRQRDFSYYTYISYNQRVLHMLEHGV